MNEEPEREQNGFAKSVNRHQNSLEIRKKCCGIRFQVFKILNYLSAAHGSWCCRLFFSNASLSFIVVKLPFSHLVAIYLIYSILKIRFKLA